MIGIGIDTGGTCTDAVIYDLEKRTVLASGKAQTTHDDLKVGILRALDSLPGDLLRHCGRIALSTTIATNACVEDRGGRGKLVLIGPDRKVFAETHASYGIRRVEDVLLVDCRLQASPEKSERPDWEAFREKIRTFLRDCDCAAVVQMFAADYNGSYEKKAAGIIREQYDIPVICGHELFPDRNLYRRGAGALLNARLVPEVQRFIAAMQEALRERELVLPMTIVRSDGTQMSGEYARLRPVETLLSGPAASVIGAGELAAAELAMVVDIGGTTTDVALIRGGIPEYAGDGIRIGPWKTFVKGLYVDTFGLGGDTAVRCTPTGELRLETHRVVPLCELAAREPSVLSALQNLDESGRSHPYPLHEFLCAGRDIAEDEGYTEEEKNLCRRLRERPLSLEEAAETLSRDVYTLHTEQLEDTGAVLRAGLTPTDMMHIRGDFADFCTEASLHAARFVVRSSEARDVEDLCGIVYERVTERLYKNLVRILLGAECESLRDAPDEQLTALTDRAWRSELERERDPEAGADSFLPELFRTPAKIIALGAPAHLFLPRVAAMLHTEVVLPPHAAVANAVGAISAEFSAVTEVTVTPVRSGDTEIYQVLTALTRKTFRNREEAFAYAEQKGQAETEARAREQGAAGPLRIIEERIHRETTHRLGTLWLEDIFRFRAEAER